MYDLLDQISLGIEHHLYYLSLFAALAIPDICGSVDTPGRGKGKERYIAWFARYIEPKYSRDTPTLVTGLDCYEFRCALLHEGKSRATSPPGGSSPPPADTIPRPFRVLFAEPNSGDDYYTARMSDHRVGEAVLVINLKVFCDNIVAGAQEWLEDMEKQGRQAELDRFIGRREEGYPPFVKHPVIA